MDKDRIRGMALKVKGRLKEVAGIVTGDRKTKTEGQVEKTEGEARNALGVAKDKLRELRDE
jgi:uncharacterized protein YjbJ (UPF0337 family)